MTDYIAVLRMGYNEYLMRMHAYNLKKQDEIKLMHEMIWLEQRVVSATNKKGEYIFKEFKDFYQEEKATKKVNPELYQVAKNLQKYERGGKR